MKLSEMNTDQLADLYMEIAPAIDSITSGEHWQEIAEAAAGGLNGKKMMTVILPIMLKYNRRDVYTIIGAVDGKGADEIAKQPFAKTLAQAREILTTDFTDFFSQSAPEEQAG